MSSASHTRILERFRALNGAERLRDHPASYTLEPRDNLLASLPLEVLDDFAGGSGGELQGDLPKFCAVHSSSALAANAFGPMRMHPGAFALAGVAGFEEARFEHQLPTGLLGTPPNLDFVAWGPAGTVAVESKFTEILSPKTAKFAASYDGAVRRLAEPEWASMFQSLRSEPHRFRHLDAAQLVKHYLGMRHSLAGAPGDRVLMYAFWEPTDAEAIPEFAAHRAEVQAFSEAVAGSVVRFVALRHQELWAAWEMSSRWPGVGAHVEALRARYGVLCDGGSA